MTVDDHPPAPTGTCRRGRLLGALVPLLLLVPATLAGAATTTVDLEDLAAGTELQAQYAAAAGVDFTWPPGDDEVPVLRVVDAPGLASSGTRVADFSACAPACEFWQPITTGRLRRSASAVSAAVGMTGPGTATSQVHLVARDAAGRTVASASTTVVEGQPFRQRLTVADPAGAATITAFTLHGEPARTLPLAFDDLRIERPDDAPPPDLALVVDPNPITLKQGDYVDMPVDLQRLDGSDGNVAIAVSELPPGVTAEIRPNPVPGTETRATVRLRADETAPPAAGSFPQLRITATPEPGAGSAVRTATKPLRIVENCEREFRGKTLHVQTEQCMRSDGPDVLVTTGNEVHVNGLTLLAGSGARELRIDKRYETISGGATAPFGVVLRDHRNLLLYQGRISWDAGDSAFPRSDGTVLDGSVTGGTLFGLQIPKVRVALVRGGKARITPTVKLGFWPFDRLGDLTSSGTFTADNEHGTDFGGLEVQVGRIPIPGLELQDVGVKWVRDSSWAGNAKVKLGLARPLTVGAGFGVKDGAFDYLKGNVAGLNAQVSPGIFLQGITFGVKRDPLTLDGSVTLSGGPKLAGKTAVSVTGGFKAVLDDPFVIEVNGRGRIAEKWTLGSAFLRYSSEGLFELGAKLDWDLGVAGVGGEIAGFVDGSRAASLEGRVKGCIRIWGPDPCAKGAFIVSSVGIAGCFDVVIVSGGVGYRWGGDFDLFSGCNLSPYRPARSTGGRGRSRAAGAPTARVRTVALADGAPRTLLAVRGEGGAPGVTLTGPRGERIAVSRAQPTAAGDGLRAALGDDGTTYLMIDRPRGGRWTIETDGSFAIRDVRQAEGLPRPSVRTTVTGRGRDRRLLWRVRPIDGQRVTLVEAGRDVRRTIATTSASRGSVRFRPADGSGGRRRILALVTQDGRPRTTVRAGTYVAPARPRPTRPRQLRASRRGAQVLVRWTGTSKRFRHAVHVAQADGRARLLIAPAGARRLRLRSLPARARIAVTGLGPANGAGPTARTVVAAPTPPRPRAGRWTIGGDLVRRGHLTVAADRRRIAAAQLTPRGDARCGSRPLVVRGRPAVAARTVGGRPRRLVGRPDRRSSDGVAPVAVTLRRGGQTVRGLLSLVVDGPRTAHGRLLVDGCELRFRARR